VIFWSFKEWLVVLEARQADSNISNNFKLWHTQFIKNYLEGILAKNQRTPNYLTNEQRAEIERYLANPLNILDDLRNFPGIGNYVGTLYNDQHYGNWSDDVYADTVDRWTKSGTQYKFDNYDTFTDYLTAAGSHKDKAVGNLHNVLDAIKFLFYAPAWARNNRVKAKAKTNVGSADGEFGTIDSMGAGDKVTRGREGLGEARIEAAKIMDCVRIMYQQIEIELRDAYKNEIDKLNSQLQSENVIRNLVHLRREFYKILVSKLLNSKEETTEGDDADYLVKDMDVLDATSLTGADASKKRQRNRFSGNLISNENMKHVYTKIKNEDPDLFDAINITNLNLWYVLVCKNVAKNKGLSNIDPMQKKEIRTAIINRLPENLQGKISHESLQAVSQNMPATFKADYPAQLSDLDKGFESLMMDLCLSTEFPSPFIAKDENRNNINIINKFLEPLMLILVKDPQMLKSLRNQKTGEYDCKDLLNLLRDENLVPKAPKKLTEE
jgi:hypothetical protein